MLLQNHLGSVVVLPAILTVATMLTLAAALYKLWRPAFTYLCRYIHSSMYVFYGELCSMHRFGCCVPPTLAIRHILQLSR